MSIKTIPANIEVADLSDIPDTSAGPNRMMLIGNILGPTSNIRPTTMKRRPMISVKERLDLLGTTVYPVSEHESSCQPS